MEARHDSILIEAPRQEMFVSCTLMPLEQIWSVDQTAWFGVAAPIVLVQTPT